MRIYGGQYTNSGNSSHTPKAFEAGQHKARGEAKRNPGDPYKNIYEVREAAAS